MFDWEKILIKPNDSLEHAIKVLQEGGYRITLVVDAHKKLLGTVTDGDIRRALLSGKNMINRISDVMNKSPVTAKKIDSREHILSLMNDMSILHIPIIDAAGVLCGLETIQLFHEKPSYDNPVFLMAGGSGKRQYP